MELINTRSVNCIYCDDVRHEVSGKTTVVGMYPDGVPVQLPLQGSLVLPKLCLIANLRTPIEQPFQSLRCELRLDDEVIHGLDMPAEAFNTNLPERKNQKWFAAQLIMELGNIILQKEGTLRFVAIVDGGQIYECPGIEFMKAEAQTLASTPAASNT